MADRTRTAGRWAALLGLEDARRATLWAAGVVVDSADLLAQGVTALAVGALGGRPQPAPAPLGRARSGAPGLTRGRPAPVRPAPIRLVRA